MPYENRETIREQEYFYWEIAIFSHPTCFHLGNREKPMKYGIPTLYKMV